MTSQGHATIATQSKILIHDDTLVWKGFGTPQEARNPACWDSFCRLRIWQLEDKYLILFSDLGMSGTGTSITNSAENIVAIVTRQFQIAHPQVCLWIEHYPELSGTHDPTLQERFAQIICQDWYYDGRTGYQARRATWRPIDRTQIEQAIGALLT